MFGSCSPGEGDLQACVANATGMFSYMQYWEHVPCKGNLAVMAVLALFDVLIASHTKGRWFALHSFANLLVVITGFKAMISCLADPLHAVDSRVYSDTSMFGNASPWPVYITNAVHVYHMVAFKLSSEEWFHHLAFIPTVGFMGQYFEWGALQGYLAFFISGLPGGIDYFMLVLTKHDIVPVITQKRVCASLNVYLRGPFILISTFVLYLAVRYGHHTVPIPVAFFVAFLAGFNSLYYTKQSVANYVIIHTIKAVNSTLPSDPKLRKQVKSPQSTMS